MVTFLFLLISTVLFFKIIQVEVVNDDSLLLPHLSSSLHPLSCLSILDGLLVFLPYNEKANY